MTTPSAMPPELARERGEVLHRALRHVPTELLAPLLRGTRRHADSLIPGVLHTGSGGGCVIGMMLRELEGRPRKRSSIFSSRCTIYEEAPDLARDNPRLAHIEFIFDRTCEELQRLTGVSWEKAARTVGLWLAAEVAGEINFRHLEEAGEPAPPAAGAKVDEALFADTVQRIRSLRPWLSESEATRMVESIVGVRRVEGMTVPPEWELEVELQRERLTHT